MAADVRGRGEERLDRRRAESLASRVDEHRDVPREELLRCRGGDDGGGEDGGGEHWR